MMSCIDECRLWGGGYRSLVICSNSKYSFRGMEMCDKTSQYDVYNFSLFAKESSFP